MTRRGARNDPHAASSIVIGIISRQDARAPFPAVTVGIDALFIVHLEGIASLLAQMQRLMIPQRGSL
jgi:hypothetical protein